MTMQGNYLIIEQNGAETPIVLPPNMGHKDAIKLFKLKLSDIRSAGSFQFDSYMRVGGFSFRCETVDVGQKSTSVFFGRGDKDAVVLRDVFEKR